MNIDVKSYRTGTCLLASLFSINLQFLIILILFKLFLKNINLLFSNNNYLAIIYCFYYIISSNLI